MPNDPLQPVSPGTPLLEAVTSDVLNALKREAKRSRDDSLTGPNGGGWSNGLTPSIEILVRNDTGDDLASGSILRITGKIGDPINAPIAFRRRPCFTGDVPDSTSKAIVLLNDPVKRDAIGRASIIGVSACDVLINSTSHEWARPIAGDETKLESAAAGPARILWKETSGGTRRCVVLLGAPLPFVEIDAVTEVCRRESTVPGDNTIVVEKTPILAIQAGERFCETNPTNCCQCEPADAPDAIPFTLASACSDLDGLGFTLIRNSAGVTAWTGTETTGANLAVELRLTYAEEEGWRLRITYDGVVVGTFTCTVNNCNPFSITCDFDACVDCGGGGYSDGSGSGSGGSGGGGSGDVLTPCCPDGTVAESLCLTSEVTSGDCPDLDALEDTLTFDAGNWDGANEHIYCVSPYIANCAAVPVRFRVKCNGAGTWSLWMLPGTGAPGNAEPVLLATVTSDALCNGDPLVFDVPFDSSGALLPPGVDDSCCVATVRFTATPRACGSSGTQDTACCDAVPSPMALTSNTNSDGWSFRSTPTYGGVTGSAPNRVWVWNSWLEAWDGEQWLSTGIYIGILCYESCSWDSGIPCWRINQAGGNPSFYGLGSGSWTETSAVCYPFELVFDDDGSDTVFTIVPG